MSNEINPQLAFAVIARIAAALAGAEVAVEVTKIPPLGGERNEDE